MSRFTYVCVAAAAMAFLALGAVAQAEIVSTMDSSDFDLGFEFTGTSDTPDNYPTVDIDGNLSQDMLLNGDAGTISGGIMTMISGGSGNCSYWDKAAGTGVWYNYSILPSDGFTIEAKVKITAQTGSYGVFALAGTPTDDPLNPGADEPDGSLRIGMSKVGWTQNGGKTLSDITTLDTSDNSDDFHIFRMALDPDTGTFTAWRNGEELGSGLTDGWVGGDYERLIFGDCSGLDNGTAEVDYVRFTKGAYAPIPEPSTVALLATGLIGLLCYAWRKRK